MIHQITAKTIPDQRFLSLFGEALTNLGMTEDDLSGKTYDQLFQEITARQWDTIIALREELQIKFNDKDSMCGSDEIDALKSTIMANRLNRVIELYNENQQLRDEWHWWRNQAGKFEKELEKLGWKDE